VGFRMARPLDHAPLLEAHGQDVPAQWVAPIERGAHWILRKRLPKDLPEAHAGFAAAGFSANISAE